MTFELVSANVILGLQMRRVSWRRVGGAEVHSGSDQLTIYGAVAACVVALPTILFGEDLLALLATILLGAVIALTIVIFAIARLRRQTTAALAMLVIFCGLSYILFKCSYVLHTTARWLLFSRNYKTQVMSQPSPAEGNLKHMEWDSWGFAGEDTIVYLVYDPSDKLAAKAASGAADFFQGVPCQVPWVYRLENGWYAVRFYTDTSWGQCQY